MQASVMKTAITLTVFFVVCWCPNNVYYLLQNVANVPFKYPAYYVTVFHVFYAIESSILCDFTFIRGSFLTAKYGVLT